MKLKDKIFIKPIRKKGVITDIDITAQTVIVRYYRDGELQFGKFRFGDIEKLRQPLQVKIKYFNKEMPKIERFAVGDWIDLRASEDVELKQFEYALIPLGIAMKLPRGFEAHIAPRSSTFKNFGIIQVNSVGVIDESYKGNDDQWFMAVVALRDTKINKFDRICQFRLIRKMNKIEFIEVDVLENNNRGGHGSTGVK